MSTSTATTKVEMQYGYRLPSGSETWAHRETASFKGSDFYLDPKDQNRDPIYYYGRAELVKRYEKHLREIGVDPEMVPSIEIIQRQIITIVMSSETAE